MDTLTLALRAAAAAPSADNSQPWRLHWDGRELAVFHRRGGGLDPFGPSGHATLMAMGALLENLVQATGIEAAAPAPEDLRRGEPYFRLALPGARTQERSGDLPLFGRHTNRFPFLRESPAPTLVRSLETSAEGAARAVVLTSPSAIGPFSDVTAVCCQARFCNPELHEWLMGSLRFTEEEAMAGDGLDLATLHLPPGGGLFMRFIKPWGRMASLNRLGAYRLMAMPETQPVRSASMVVAIVGADNTPGTLEAGRLMQRTWIELNRAGWAVHPYYVVVDQQTRLKERRLPADWQISVRQAVDELPGILGLNAGERMHMALRVGRPKVRNPPKSRRLPLERMYSEGPPAG